MTWNFAWMPKSNNIAVTYVYAAYSKYKALVFFSLLRFCPFFSDVVAIDRSQRVMITKHVKHGEVYVLAREKKFFFGAKSCRETW